MKNISAVDTNIIKFNDKYWLFTNLDSSKSGEYSSELHIYYADKLDSTSWKPHLLNPVIFDSRKARNGGIIYSQEGQFYRVFQNIRGGLGISVSIVGALLAASTGIVGATVVTMGLLSLPTMLSKGYDPKIATGTVAAAGTLGQIIPPSIVLVLLGDVLSNAYQKSQLDMGVFSPETLSVGELFAGALLPGIVLVLFYILYQIIKSFTDPSSIPDVIKNQVKSKNEKNILLILFPPLFLIISVLGSILHVFL